MGAVASGVVCSGSGAQSRMRPDVSAMLTSIAPVVRFGGPIFTDTGDPAEMAHARARTVAGLQRATFIASANIQLSCEPSAMPPLT